MSSTEQIEHDAFVREVKDDFIIVDVLAKSACMSCQMKGVCSVSDIEEKSVKVQKIPGINIERGQKVTVFMGQKQGFNAVFLGYILPFIILMITLVATIELTGNDGLGGLLAIASLVPYYFILWLFRKKIDKKYKFQLKI